MVFISLLILFALAIPPSVAIYCIASHWLKRNSPRQPTVVAAIPLGLSAIALLLTHAAAILLFAFHEIARMQDPGVALILIALLRAQQPLFWGFVDLILSLFAILLFAIYFKYARDEESHLMQAFTPLPALLFTLLASAALFLLAQFQYGTVDLVLAIVDPRRFNQLALQTGVANMDYYAAQVSSRLLLTAVLSCLLFFALLLAGILNLVWRHSQTNRQALATFLILGTLAGCCFGALQELNFVNSLRQLQ